MTTPTPVSFKAVALYALLGVVAMLTALTVLIVSGHDTNVLIGAITALVPVIVGIGALLKQGAVVKQQTNGNQTQLVNALMQAHQIIARSVPASAVTVTSPTPVPAPILPPLPPVAAAILADTTGSITPSQPNNPLIPPSLRPQGD